MAYKLHLFHIFDLFWIVEEHITRFISIIEATNIVNQFQQQKIQYMQNQASLRKNRLQSIRDSLKQNPVLKTRTNAVENKIEKRRKRRESVVMDDNLSESQKHLLLEEDDISVKAMTKFYEKYAMGEKIGEGSNGLVKKCYLKSTNQLFAVKAMKMDEEHILFLKNNFRQIHALDHPNIVKYRTMYLDLKNKICFLVMDYQIHPNLLEFKDLEEDEIKTITQQLLDTVAYIHSQNICHRDIKPQNILYDRQNNSIKLIDFGISKNIFNRGKKQQMLTITGTLYYRAPEMFSGGGYDQRVDVWAVGITLYQMITGKTPFQSEYLSTTIENIQKGQIHFDDEVWNQYGKSVKDLVSRLLKKRQERFTASEAKTHFWFNKRPSQPIDLSKSESLGFKIGKIQLSNQKYAQDSDQTRINANIPQLKIRPRKSSINDNSSNSDGLIEIQSQGERELDSPISIVKKPPVLMKQPEQFNLNNCQVSSIPST